MSKYDWFIIAFTGFILALTLEISLTESGRYVKYDCRTVNTNPDMPEKVKELCRNKK